MWVLAATAPDVACLHSESSTVAPWCFGAYPNSLSHRSKDLLHHARARSLTSESSGHRVVRSLRFQSLRVWPFKKLILVLAELLGLYGQPEPAGPASACLAVAGSDAALLGVQKDRLAVAPDSTCARYAGLGLRCCPSSARHRRSPA